MAEAFVAEMYDDEGRFLGYTTGTRPGHFCIACDRVYPSRVAADQCAREDAEDDRNQRIQRSSD